MQIANATSCIVVTGWTMSKNFRHEVVHFSNANMVLAAFIPVPPPGAIHIVATRLLVVVRFARRGA